VGLVLISIGLGVVVRNISAFIILKRNSRLLFATVELGSILVAETELFKKILRDLIRVLVICLWIQNVGSD